MCWRSCGCPCCASGGGPPRLPTPGWRAPAACPQSPRTMQPAPQNWSKPSTICAERLGCHAHWPNSASRRTGSKPCSASHPAALPWGWKPPSRTRTTAALPTRLCSPPEFHRVLHPLSSTMQTSSHLRTGTYPLLIDGQERSSSAGQHFDVDNPSTGRVLAQVTQADANDVDAAVRAAQTAFDTHWRHTSARQRSRLLRKLADALERRTEQLAWLETWNVGRPITLTRATLGTMLDGIDSVAGGGADQGDPRHPGHHARRDRLRRRCGPGHRRLDPQRGRHAYRELHPSG